MGVEGYSRAGGVQLKINFHAKGDPLHPKVGAIETEGGLPISNIKVDRRTRPRNT